MDGSLPRMGRGGAFGLHAAILAVFLGASAVPTPVYPLYQHLWGFPAATTTVIFAVYALALLASLLVVGRLADHVGSRPVLLAAITVELASMAVFMTAGGVVALLAARILQGLATGAAMGAAGSALMVFENRHRRGSAALVNAVAAPVGLALGATGASVSVDMLPAPTRLCYLIVALTVVVLAALLVFAPGSGTTAFGPHLRADSVRSAETVRNHLGGHRTAEIAARQPSMTKDEAIAKALGVTPPARKQAAVTSPLTAREREIAVLVAEGLSNRAIAQTLVISPRTVDGHVEHVLSKLGFVSRAQIASCAARETVPTLP